MTTTWSDGSRGPIGISVPEAMLSSEMISELNKKFMNRAFVLSSEGKSHFMTADTWTSMLKGMMTNAFANQRKKLRLKPNVPGLLLCDGWTGFHSWRTGLDTSRAAWAKANHVVQADTQAGGWSACGQPCDQLHHLLRARFDLVDAAEGGCLSDLRILMASFFMWVQSLSVIYMHSIIYVYIYISYIYIYFNIHIYIFIYIYIYLFFLFSVGLNSRGTWRLYNCIYIYIVVGGQSLGTYIYIYSQHRHHLCFCHFSSRQRCIFKLKMLFQGFSHLQYYCSGVHGCALWTYSSRCIQTFHSLSAEEAEKNLMKCLCARVANRNIHGSTRRIWWIAQCVHGSQCWGLEERVDVTHDFGSPRELLSMTREIAWLLDRCKCMSTYCTVLISIYTYVYLMFFEVCI